MQDQQILIIYVYNVSSINNDELQGFFSLSASSDHLTSI